MVKRVTRTLTLPSTLHIETGRYEQGDGRKVLEIAIARLSNEALLMLLAHGAKQHFNASRAAMERGPRGVLMAEDMAEEWIKKIGEKASTPAVKAQPKVLPDGPPDYLL